MEKKSSPLFPLAIKPLITSAKNVKTATATPKRPILFAIISSFSCKGVYSSSMSKSCSTLPIWVLGPTAATSALPSPVSINVLFKIKGLSYYIF